MRSRIQNKLKKILSLDEQTKIEKRLKRISSDIEKYIEENNIEKRKRILWGPSFNFEFYSVIHNTILCNSLKLRGAEIIPLSCSGVQYTECTVMGGDYGGYGAENYPKMRAKTCQFCGSQDKKIFEEICGNKLVNLNDYIPAEEREDIIRLVYGLKDDEIYDYQYDDIDFGALAKNVTLNNYLSGTLDGLKYKYESGRNYLISALILHNAYKRFLDNNEVDLVITSGGDYFQFILLRILANRKNIDAYHYNYAGREGTWTYALNDASNAMNFQSAWAEYQKNSLTEAQNQKLNNYLQYRTLGAKADVLSYVHENRKEFKELSEVWENYNNEQPLVLLAANMVWDAAALNKEIFFDDMFQWTIETIKYFMKHPEWQLIVKAHPAESHSKIRKTNQTLLGEINKAGLNLTENILILPPDTKISPYDIYSYCDLGLVYTSTVGIELAMMGKPVIISGYTSYRKAGFTTDPETSEEYFERINEFLGSPANINRESIINLSRKYFYFYHFHFLIDTGIAAYKWGETPRFKIESYNELLPGNNKYIDYVCESILENMPLVSARRWPPES